MAVFTEDFEDKSQEDGVFPKARHIFGLMGFLGFAVVYSMRVNLSIAIVTMVNQTTIPHHNINNSTADETCSTSSTSSASTTTSLLSPFSNISKHQSFEAEGEFDWDETTQGLVLGSFYYGYTLTQIPGGRMAEIYGGKMIYGIGVLTCAVFTLLTPLAARWNLTAMLAVRFIAGLCEGVTYPSIHVMLSHWIPPLERSTFSAMVYCGSYIGTFVSLPFAGWLCTLDFMDGWPLAFYIFGIFGIVWFGFWMYLVHEWPSTHPRISPSELAFIERSVKLTQSESHAASAAAEMEKTPWLSILTSLPLWAIVITQFAWSWSLFTLMTELPTYMDQILHFDVQSNSALSGLPFLTTYLMGVLCSRVAEWFLENTNISLVNSYRLWNSIAMVIPAFGLIGAAQVGCNGTWVMVMLAGLGAFSGAIYASIQLNHINLSPKYAGTMYGLTNTIGCMTGFLSPYVTGLIISGNNTLAQWRYVFYLAAALNFVGNLFYIRFVSTEEQSWSINSKNR
ncbi:sialin-like [Eupeodes corollae]|uniref:sialin-like n=1 Tax=Eupeodes corollae TaxID=290404 RepID=UPI0024916866|nr:sialin-like [Eupeodes corollae]